MKINPKTLKDGVTNTFRHVAKLGDLDTMGVYVAKLGDLDTMGVYAIVPLRAQLPRQPLLRAHRLQFLRQQAGGIARACRKNCSTGTFLTILYPELKYYFMKRLSPNWSGRVDSFVYAWTYCLLAKVL